MATSEARIRANRRNCLKSTGPQSEVGKSKARLNAIKHGMTSAVVLLPDDEQALHQRIEEWAPQYPVHDLEDQWKRRQLVQATLQIDLCQDQARQQRLHEARRALLCWDEDQAAQAEALGTKLGKNPARTVAELRTNRAGADWLLQRWVKLELMLDNGEAFEEEQHQLMLNLLGSPLTTRKSDLEALAELPVETTRGLVRQEIENLQQLLEKSLVPIEAIEREMAEKGLPAKESAELKRIRRYEAAHWRRYEQAKAHWPPREPRPRPLAPQANPADNQECTQTITKKDESQAPAKPEANPEPARTLAQLEAQNQIERVQPTPTPTPTPTPVVERKRPKLTREQLKALQKRYQPCS